MDSKVEMAHCWAVNQSAGDHDPACQSLRDEEQSHHRVDAKFLPRDRLLEEEIENRNGVCKSRETRDEAVYPFDVEDVLICLKGHGCIDLEIFRGQLVFCEFSFPGLRTDGRDNPADRIPFHDG